MELRISCSESTLKRDKSVEEEVESAKRVKVV